MSTIPPEYLTGHDFGFSAVDEIPTDQIQITNTEIIDDVEGINDNVLRIEQKVDALISAMNGLNNRMGDLDNEFDTVKAVTETEVRSKLIELEKLIMPLLVNLLKTADKPYIHWPDRAMQIQNMIDKVIQLTRN